MRDENRVIDRVGGHCNELVLMGAFFTSGKGEERKETDVSFHYAMK